jgi:GNAT superfamily N-acetyltransferase
MWIDSVKKSELTELAALYKELTGTETNMEKLEDSFAFIDTNPDYALIAAKEGHGALLGSLLGVICHDAAGDCRPFMVIENVIVRAAYRGQGIGKQLMEHIEAWGRQRECYYVMFVSASSRKASHRFYESAGYSLTAVQGFKKYL